MVIVAIVFFVFMALGMPVAFAIGIAGLTFFLQNPDLPFTIPFQITVSQTQNFALLAVPLFIMAGNFMNRSGITERLLDLASVITGRMKGGLAQVSVLLSGLMGGVSGSAIADAAMQSRVLGDEMVRRGMSPGFTAGVISFGSILTPIVPPGIGMILFGTIGQVSIGRLFAAGFFPAILLWVGLSFAIWLTAKKRGYPPQRTTRPTLAEYGTAFRGGIWALLFPVFLLAGLRMGIFTPSEIGAFAVVYALFIGFLIYRKMNGRGFLHALEVSLGDVGSVMFLITLSAIFSYGIVFERIPEVISGSITGVTSNVSAVMVIIVLLVIVAGCFIDATVLIIMMTPIFLPLVRSLGGDPVHFGIVFIVAATIGNFTPPVGAAMYTVCSILKVPIGTYTRESIPLMIAIGVVALFLIFVPGAVLFLPNLLFN
ncbi:TRAP transporter large permease subunit [Terrihabitans rhizophilus]|uniref:TRAP transporter large permease protein n=1 Tax=Terrihabitans rhizophilus TaxID=3092662 RepID=A0ABU4RQ03_9HYPH|nr:TRAP transporter large permease subunit [Terrihabitans sp. PJ23]MDX6806184.1 TRAP transporter large permease subunit [Terrihabitans sp. PJ23]